MIRTVSEQQTSLTDLIRRVHDGETGALQSVFELTYDELRRLARYRLQTVERAAVLDTTGLVHECYLRLASAKTLAVEDRVHFFRYAGRAMRCVIVDMARGALRTKRGNGERPLSLSTTICESTSAAAEEEVLSVHDALDDLAQIDPRLVQVVEMRYFAGMTEADIATALGVTDRTIRRDWEKARLLLARALAS
ncbi:MAG TPA: ECF-type sigma factor [Steroidobacteraceae bacterium]|jgi:RNA polymerase sigma factor (TIGR02999 family)|nr:ECF-type sigma factor [Steroidobacteraceae bacterium]